MRRAVPATLVCLLMIAGTASAQYIVYDAQQRDHPLPGARPSVRLEGMGGLALVVPDENNEINLSDFGDNIAGIISDRDGWSIETWGGRDLDQSRFRQPLSGSTLLRDASFDRALGGADVVYRKPGRRAVGGTINWTAHSTRESLGPATKVRGPDVFAFYNQVLGRLTLGAGVTSWSDDESVTSPDPFAIHHYSRTLTGSFAAAYALGSWTAAGQMDVDRVTIHGVDADPAGFHSDEFEWARPATRLHFSLIRPEGGKVAAGLNLSMLRRRGTEEAYIRWSDRYPDNPSHFNMVRHIPTFEEKEDGWGLEGRCLLKATGMLNLGGYGWIGNGTTKVTETPNANFVGSRRAEDSVQRTWRFGAGVGLSPTERLRAGVEGYLDGQKDTQHTTGPDQILKTRDLELRAGAEWLLPSHLALRAGFTTGSADENLDLAGNLYMSDGLSVGMGYLPRGGMFSLDGALRLARSRPDYSGGQQKRTDVQDFAFAAAVRPGETGGAAAGALRGAP
jgi:hypothetical protein